MRKILIDTYKIKNLYSGLGQFSLNFAKELIVQRPSTLKLHFLIPNKANKELIKKDSELCLIKANFQKRYFPFLNEKYDIWHSLHQFPSHLPNKEAIWILTIHDLNFLLEKNEQKSASYLKQLQKNVDRANYITTISNYSKSLIEKYLNLKGKSIQVIHNGVASNCIGQDKKPGFIGEEKFFFSIGIFNEKKNFRTLLPLMKHFNDHKLILAGNIDTPYGKYIQSEIAALNMGNKILLPGKINESDKYWLYNNCEAFLFPSLAEGFGMPVIEAMKAGKAVFLSRHTSLPEIGGNMAFYFDNFDELEMCHLIKNSLNKYNANHSFYEHEIKKHAESFCWDASISKYLELYDKIKH
ncbi:MAG: glycosyltransferase family 4 protein [Bacteroidetes bacterium]|nr:glycosyltransferase family 4 protein [Bacteroidota bacterium]